MLLLLSIHGIEKFSNCNGSVYAQVNVLDKSRNDWKELKKSDTSLDEELEIHKKSNNQYLDKANFLHRATVKEYENDLNRRLASDVRTRGRL